MNTLLTSPISEITLKDIRALIDKRASENEKIEFKKDLPSATEKDPWWEQQQKIGERAKCSLLHEVVAFANADGGVVVLGIEETASKPPTASTITPLPQCAELAERFKLIFRDCVEPELPTLEIFSVRINGDAGVVVFRAGKSQKAPHRVTKTLVCPIRRSDRCQKMTMQEIQDKTLEVFHGLNPVEKQLAQRSEIFPEELKHIENPDIAVGFRVTAMPLGREFQIDRVFGQGRISEGYDIFWHKVLQGSNPIALESMLYHYAPSMWKPILRGARKHHPWSHKPLLNAYCEIHCDGLMEIGFVSCDRLADQREPDIDLLFHPYDPIVFFANALVWAHRVRIQAEFPLVDIAIDAEILVRGQAAAVCSKREIGYFHYSPKWLQPGSPIKFPRYSLGESDRIPYLLNRFYGDFLNSMERDASDMGELIIARMGQSQDLGRVDI